MLEDLIFTKDVFSVTTLMTIFESLINAGVDFDEFQRLVFMLSCIINILTFSKTAKQENDPFMNADVGLRKFHLTFELIVKNGNDVRIQG